MTTENQSFYLKYLICCQFCLPLDSANRGGRFASSLPIIPIYVLGFEHAQNRKIPVVRHSAQRDTYKCVYSCCMTCSQLHFPSIIIFPVYLRLP